MVRRPFARGLGAGGPGRELGRAGSHLCGGGAQKEGADVPEQSLRLPACPSSRALASPGRHSERRGTPPRGLVLRGRVSRQTKAMAALGPTTEAGEKVFVFFDVIDRP